MKIGLYNPYLDTVGGGERYFLSLAEYFVRNKLVYFKDKGEVEIILDKNLEQIGLETIKKRIEERLGFDLSFLNFKSGPFGKNSSAIERYFFTKNYDLFFCVSDGGVFFSGAKKNILIIQAPKIIPKSNFWQKIKLKSWQIKLCYSDFVKKIVDADLGIVCQILAPAAELDFFKPLPKKNIILSVGRFFSFLHAKKQDVLIEVFKKMCDAGLESWQLYLAGGVEKGQGGYLEKIKKEAKDYPIEFFIDVSREVLQKSYGEAKIYWHATGFGEDLDLYPEKAEHFGITTIEAMSAGCVPVVFAGGGQQEIVGHGVSGFLWQTTEELIESTKEIINDEKLREKLSEGAQKRGQDFSKEKFYERLKQIID